MSELGGLDTYVGGGVHLLADDLAVAWLALSDIGEGGTGKGVRLLEEYVPEEWAKDVRRRLRGYAETHPRPERWPWVRPEFAQFWVDSSSAESSG